MSLLLLDSSSPAGAALGPLTIDGQFFKQGGERFTIIESSDFSLFKRFMQNESIYDVVAQRRDLGFNMLRVWLLNTSVVEGGIMPSQYPDFYKGLRDFGFYIRDYGRMNLDVTACTQTQTLMPLKDDQQRHLDRSAEALDGLGTTILSLVNEADQHDNATASGLVRPSCLYSAGSNGSDIWPPDESTDCGEYHANDLDEWQRKTGHNAAEIAWDRDVPCWTSEATRAPDQDDNEAHFEDAAAGAALLCAGSCFHSVNGKASKLFTGQELKCAEAHVRGAQSVPLEFQQGRYIHRDDLEGNGVIRVYERRLPDGRGHLVRIRA